MNFRGDFRGTQKGWSASPSYVKFCDPGNSENGRSGYGLTCGDQKICKAEKMENGIKSVWEDARTEKLDRGVSSKCLVWFRPNLTLAFHYFRNSKSFKRFFAPSNSD